MKRILKFKAFESLSGLSEDQNGWLVKCTRGIWSVGVDGKVNVEGSFDCSRQNLMDFKEVKFGRVSGSFYCHDNDLTSLEGAPREVGGGFYCQGNKLVTLEGSPETVGGDFSCINNRLTTLDGSPDTIGGSFSCRNNRLTTLEGAPEGVGRDFLCQGNNLTSLEGAPKVVGGDFSCYENALTTLEGSPDTIGGSFSCRNNRLTTLEGAPETIGGEFYSDSIKISRGQWGLPSWLKTLEEGKLEAQKLIATLVSPEALNKRLEESPETTMVSLKSVWNSPVFAKIRSELKIPKGYEDEMDLMGDLDDIGL